MRHAIQTYENVGEEVRGAIKRIGGTLPENIPSAEHIKEVEKRVKTAPLVESTHKQFESQLAKKASDIALGEQVVRENEKQFAAES